MASASMAKMSSITTTIAAAPAAAEPAIPSPVSSDDPLAASAHTENHITAKTESAHSRWAAQRSFP